MAENIIATLRKRIARYQTFTGTKDFVKILPKIVDEYNNTVHSSTKFTPRDAQLDENQPEVWENLFGDLIGKEPKPLKFRANQLVRISSSKLTFSKPSAEIGWTPEIFQIYKTYKSYPANYYALRDTTRKRNIIKGDFKQHLF